MVVFVDPRAEPGRVAEPYEAPDLGSVESLRIGLLANGFPDSVAFLDQVETALTSRLPGVSFERYDKGDASSVIGPAMLDELAGRCHAVVAAYGHWGSCTTGTVRDGIEAARRGLAAVSLVTEVFWEQGNFVARSFGMPDIPRTRLPHPVAGTGTHRMAVIADEVVDDVVARLGLVSS